MKAQIEQLIDLYDFTTGRRLFAMQNTLKEAEARELTRSWQGTSAGPSRQTSS